MTIALADSFLNDNAGRYGSSFADGLRAIARRVARRQISVLEYGAGESTRIWAEEFAELAPCIITLDNEREYLLSVAASIPVAPVHFRHLDLTGPCDSQRDQGCAYSTYPLSLNREFDLVFIDGRRRLECATVASQVAAPGGLVVVHDHERSRYALIRDLFERSEVLEQFLLLQGPKLRRARPTRNGEKRAIVSVVSSPMIRAEHEITRGLAKAYAEGIGAEYVVCSLPDATPGGATKFAARPVLDAYDRVCMLDTDIVVTPGSPDIFQMVPSGAVGAWRQDRTFVESSANMAKEARRIYGSPRPPSREYINSGVLVLPREHYNILDTPPGDFFLGHPLFENSHVNERIFDEGRPFFNLSGDMNFIPDARTSLDHRFGWFVHVAGAGKSGFRNSVAWESCGRWSDKEWLTRTALLGRHTRMPRLKAIAASVLGRPTVAFDPDDLEYLHPSFIYIANGSAHVAIPAVRTAPEIRTYGPYRQVASGSYHLHVDFDPGLTDEASTIAIDVVASAGGQTIVPLTAVPIAEGIRFDLVKDAHDLETRLYTNDATTMIRGLLLERVGPA